MRFYLDYTVCATPYLAHDTYLHGPGISVCAGEQGYARQLGVPVATLRGASGDATL